MTNKWRVLKDLRKLAKTRQREYPGKINCEYGEGEISVRIILRRDALGFEVTSYSLGSRDDDNVRFGYHGPLGDAKQTFRHEDRDRAGNSRLLVSLIEECEDDKEVGQIKGGEVYYRVFHKDTPVNYIEAAEAFRFVLDAFCRKAQTQVQAPERR